MRVLFIARYRDPSMHRKVQWMAQSPDVTIQTIYPARWDDGLVAVSQSAADEGRVQRRVLGMFGEPTDPHRAFYRTLTFGLATFRPQIIHAEEEPDSLAALQIALCRHLFAPQARLLLHTWQNLDRPLSPAVERVQRLTLAAADGIFCANEEAVALLRRRGYTRPAPLIPAIGVDTELFKPGPYRCDPLFTVGYVGRLVAEKGIDTLLDGVAQLLALPVTRPVRLQIVGAGPEEAALRHQAAAANLARVVEFLPPAPPAEIARRMTKLSALVLPSRTTAVWKEQLGRVLLEAMATGVPVVGSETGAIPEVIGGCGLIFAEGDAAGLAHQLHRLSENPLLAEELIRRGMERAREMYSQQALAARTVAFYRENCR